MKAKEDKIREAYGEYWESVKDFVDQNGFIWEYSIFSKTKNNLLENIECENKLLKYSEVGNSPMFYLRPKSLQGIENNNGWLPYIGNSIGYLDIVYTDKENVYPYAVYVQYSSINELQKITHYQQITCPPKPLY